MVIPRLVLAAAGLALAGCATTYEMTLMPRDSGKLYAGTLFDAGRGQGNIAVDIDAKHYTGTWVDVTPDRTVGWSFGAGFGRGRFGFGGLGASTSMDNPNGIGSKALLNAQDGSGLRCDFNRADRGGGGGMCRDDAGKTYDVQLRPASRG